MGIVSHGTDTGGQPGLGVIRAVKAMDSNLQQHKFKLRAVWPNQTIP